MRETPGSIARFGLLMTLAVGLVYGVLRWFELPIGEVVDWALGLSAFWWMLLLLTLPWNVHFRAREVWIDAETSRKRGIEIDLQDHARVKSWASRALRVALALHAVTALSMAALAWGLGSPVGYVGAALAAVSTGFRPGVRLYDHLLRRLGTIGEEMLYPREDARSFQVHLDLLFERTERLERMLEPGRRGSFAYEVEETSRLHAAKLERLHHQLQELDVSLGAELRRVESSIDSKIAGVSADHDFLEHVRALIRFYKAS